MYTLVLYYIPSILLMKFFGKVNINIYSFARILAPTWLPPAQPCVDGAESVHDE